MLRFRRYRVFLIFAVFTIGALYHFTSVRDWENTTAISVEGLRKYIQTSSLSSSTSSSNSDPTSSVAKETPKDALVQTSTASAPKKTSIAVPPPISVAPTASPAQQQALITSGASLAGPSTILVSSHAIQKGSSKGEEVLVNGPPVQLLPSSVAEAAREKFEAKGQGRHEVPLHDEPATKIHWERLPEHFAIPSQSLIPIPTGKPKPIPKIQFDFKDESSNSKIDRERQLQDVKQVFKTSWAGYREHAWLMDELSPISGKSRNPFCGWAATLVDSLDTLWIMGLKEEFDEAAKAVDSIDFTTTMRSDIPVFETVIRYLGGLIAAYDLSGGKYQNLLHKATELAEVLMGAFDTPNRMPTTFYYWKPAFAANAHRAGTRVVLAELGSLSVEFTRLAQITKEAKYYDAIARITNEFEIWQNHTNLPGLWPISVDASGCKKPEMKTTPMEQVVLNGGKDSLYELASAQVAANTGNERIHGGHLPHSLDSVDSPSLVPPPASEGRTRSENKSGTELPETEKTDQIPIEKVPTVDDVARTKAQLGRRQLPDEDFAATQTIYKPDVPEPVPSKQPDCEAQGLSSPPKMVNEEFSLGGRSDSTYEYLPKEYMLLGGLEDRYRTMYEQSIEAIKTHLLYRPMVPGGRNILFSGHATVKATGKSDGVDAVTLTAEATHLTCFAGGMFAVGAKIFGHEADMDIAAKLTDGCVWAYEATNTGIMPEDATLISCEDPQDCAWNETRWHEELDPFRESRERSRLAQEERSRKAKEQALADVASKVEVPQREAQTPEAVLSATPGAQPNEYSEPTQAIAPPTGALRRRQVNLVENDISDNASNEATEAYAGNPTRKVHQQDIEDDVAPTNATEDFIPTPTQEIPQRDIKNEVAPGKSVEGSAGTPTQKAPQQEIEKSTDFDKKTETVEGYAKTVGEAAGAAGKKLASGGKPIPVTPPAPPPVLTHEQHVEGRIRNERLPPGFIDMKSKKYILRPEAIESVFIMYRATGDDYWREKGWKMFTAIQRYTRAEYGNSAIHDVTDPKTFGLDEMESFWLAETLKYFYLLFSDPSVVSLDDYILNTEAHPFKRPK